MSDDPVSFVTKIITNVSGKTTRKGIAIQAVITGIVLLLLHFIIMIVEPDSFTAITVKPYFNGVVYFAIMNLIAMAYLVVKQPFVTPEVKHATCNFCGASMSTALLSCENCKSKSEKGN
jgi:hypothetical protein